jgi:hypothetical protein
MRHGLGIMPARPKLVRQASKLLCGFFRRSMTGFFQVSAVPDRGIGVFSCHRIWSTSCPAEGKTIVARFGRVGKRSAFRGGCAVDRTTGDWCGGEHQHHDVLRIPHHPCYAGAFVFGRTRTSKLDSKRQGSTGKLLDAEASSLNRPCLSPRANRPVPPGSTPQSPPSAPLLARVWPEL